jgi:hypothetical protein
MEVTGWRDERQRGIRPDAVATGMQGIVESFANFFGAQVQFE